MLKGIDCATQITRATAAAFKADGVGFIIRYLSRGWKGISLNEAAICKEFGLEIASVFELGGQREDLVGSKGYADGQQAYQISKSVGQPEWSTNYMAVDYDAQLSDMDNIYAYLMQAEKAMPGYEVGCYGSYYVVEEMHKRGIKHLWQTLAWSPRGVISKFANIYQSDNDVKEHGINIDHDQSFGGEGWWSTMDDILKQLNSLATRVTALEQTTKVLEKTTMPKWFIDEFGAHSLDGIVTDLTGDTDFWRDTAIILREFKAKNL
jgi:hypothetical protein